MKTRKREKVRVTTTLSSEAIQRAEKLMDLLPLTNLNELVELLIREEYERRHGKIIEENNSSGKQQPKRTKAAA